MKMNDLLAIALKIYLLILCLKRSKSCGHQKLKCRNLNAIIQHDPKNQTLETYRYVSEIQKQIKKKTQHYSSLFLKE